MGVIFRLGTKRISGRRWAEIMKSRIRYCRDSKGHMSKEAELAREPEVYSRALLRKYGITLPEYEEKLEKQGGVCALCGKVPRRQRNALRTFHIDEDHKTGKIRGLLCCLCNTSLGGLGDTVEGVERALRYLKGEKV